MTLRPVPPLDEQITGIIRGGHPETETVQRILAAVEGERGRLCTDPDCARLIPHSRLGPHAWRHEPGPPLGHPFPFTWTCFNCGQPSWTRIHRTGRRRPV